jgi:copper(I)-binding protein
VAAALMAVGGATAAGGQKPMTASEAWIAEPAADSRTAELYGFVENPSAYDAYIVSATTDVAGGAEILDGSRVVTEALVPAYGSAEFKPGGLRIRLNDLKRLLKAGDRVTVTLKTNEGASIETLADVKKP